MYKVVTRKGLINGKASDFSGIDVQYIEVPLLTEEDIIKNAGDADAVIVGAMEPYSRRVIEAMTRCKIISRNGIGFDNIDIETATEQGIPVAYVPDASIGEVSDHAVGLMLCLSRQYLPVSLAVREGAWQPGRPEIPAIRNFITRLSEQTLGLVGLGRIGSATCKKAKALGVRIIIYDPYVQAKVITELGAEQVSFDQLLAESDYISLHVPLTRETKHLFGLEQFKKMKPTAYLINTSRGGLVNEEALVTALSQGYLAGAALDVLDREPPNPDNPLLKMKNVMITAHTAFYSPQSLAGMRQSSIDSVVAALSGKWPRNLVNPQVKERPNCRLK